MKYEINLPKLPNQVLREKSKNVPIPLTEEDIQLAEKMIWHISESQKPNSKFQPGVGVAAVQYGILKNVFHINIDGFRFNNETYFLNDVFFNPKIIAKGNYDAALSSGEGCLSVGPNTKGQEGYVIRKNRIVFEAYSYREKKVKRFDLSGYPAIVAQHELDHLEGKLFIDRINKTNPTLKPANIEIISPEWD
ncbi:peptide deformylase [Mycoplasma sp. Mirounga ES2805-ORL]|uniref:peptide deformylase n=1 Tax=Mycoplasma sp. Mirounga ES2805-ORL TaxID=754514 RepID=UPI00197B0E25|nr:peptide deformylase [Mycoplasma sp. Mirounga ES2805-ORL]QSF13405.1 peptide deformylase [Mycoplasma sp. Mirounga ES2805-ORL]